MEKYGFVYIWYDRKHKRYYIGCRWGREDDGYICSSPWMKQSYHRRPEDFRRRILSMIYTNKKELLEEEYRWLCKIKTEELGKKYYNLHNHHFGHWSTDVSSRLSVSEKIKKHHSDPNFRMRLSKSKLGELNPMKKPDVVMKRVATYKSNVHVPWNKGKKLGPNIEHSERMKGRTPTNKGLKMSQESRLKISKKWIITTPSGEIINIQNLNEYCSIVGIKASNMRNVADGKRKSCSGYTCERVS